MLRPLAEHTKYFVLWGAEAPLARCDGLEQPSISYSLKLAVDVCRSYASDPAGDLPFMYRNRSLPCFVIAATLLVVATPALAVDDAAAFVEALRKRGRHDLALEYLAGAEERALTSDAFRKRLPYERAITRLDQTRTIKNPSDRSSALDQAAVDLKKFTSQTDDKRLAAEIEARLAGGYASTSQIEKARADSSRNGSKRDKVESYLQAARQAIDKASQSYTAADKHYQQELEKYKQAVPKTPEHSTRTELRAALAQTRLLKARLIYQKAQTYEAGSDRFESLCTEAGEELQAFYEKYSRWLIGLYAHLYEGQCYLSLKQYKLASGCFEDLTSQPAQDPAFRRLITLAHGYLAQARIEEGKISAALRDGQAWYDRLQKEEITAPDANALAYQLAKAMLISSKKLEGAREKRQLEQARELLQIAAKYGNEFQSKARLALSGVNSQLGKSSGGPVNTFDEAYQEVRSTLSKLDQSKQAVKLTGNDNPQAAEFAQQVAEYRTKSVNAIRRALELTDESTPLPKINEVRSSLAFLHWDGEEYLQASAVGGFLAKRYPSDSSAQQAANIAIVSLQKLYFNAKTAGEDGRFESDQLRKLAETIIKNWPKSKTASTAASVLVSIALREKRLDKVQPILDLVDAESRVVLELQLASSVWEQALRELAQADDVTRSAAQKSKTSAAEQLKSAFEKGRDVRPVSPQLAAAGLYLAQAYLEEGKALDAVTLLEDKKVGPLTLVNRSASAASRAGYATEVYKLAMRSYVSISPPRTEQALKTMKSFEQAVRADGGDAESQRKKLSRTYFGLGVQLQRQIAALIESRKKKQARQLSTAFAAFLKSLSKQSQDADWTTRQWIGQMYLQLADGLAGSQQAKGHQEKARDVFASMIARAKTDPSYAPKPASVLAARVQLGQSQRKLGQYPQAMETFTQILKERNASFDVQKYAAYTLQEWGADKDLAQLDKAVRGAQLDPKTRKNLIWGWNKLGKYAASAARKQPKYKQVFFEAWLNIATCRVIAAEQTEGAKRDKSINSATKTISSMLRQYPDLGGDNSMQQFDELAKRIQKIEGDQPVGLKAFAS